MEITAQSARIEGSVPGGRGVGAWMDTCGDVLSGYAAAVECYPQWHAVALVARKGHDGLFIVSAPDEAWLDDLRNDPDYVVLDGDLRAYQKDAAATFEARAAAEPQEFVAIGGQP